MMFLMNIRSLVRLEYNVHACEWTRLLLHFRLTNVTMRRPFTLISALLITWIAWCIVPKQWSLHHNISTHPLYFILSNTTFSVSFPQKCWKKPLWKPCQRLCDSTLCTLSWRINYGQQTWQKEGLHPILRGRLPKERRCVCRIFEANMCLLTFGLRGADHAVASSL